MGAMADSVVGYAQVLIDQTDGSREQVQKALTLATVCWNLAILPEAEHDEFLAEMRETLQMEDEKFRAFRTDVIEPMIRRHRAMFPGLDPARRQMLRNGGESR